MQFIEKELIRVPFHALKQNLFVLLRLISQKVKTIKRCQLLLRT